VKWLPFLACYLIPRGSRVHGSLLSLFFFPWCFLLWVFSALLVLSGASSFFCFVGALYVAWVLFYVGLFSVRTFFFGLLLPLFRHDKSNLEQAPFSSKNNVV
jgi:hypothetical protein